MRLTKSAGAVIGLTVVCLVSWPWVDAWRVRSGIRPHADAPALSHFDQLGVWRRAEVGREALEAIARLKRIGWTPRLTSLEARGEDGDDARFVYRLATGTTAIQDCRGVEDDAATAECDGLVHARPGGVGEPQEHAGVGLVVDLRASRPQAESRGAALLDLGRGGAAVRGRLRVVGEVVHLTSAELRVPHPADPDSHDFVPIDGEVTLGAAGQASFVTRTYEFKIEREPPALLRPLFGDEPFVLIGLRAQIRVDLAEAHPRLRAVGEIKVLNTELAHGALEYLPGEYVVVYLRSAVLPTPMPGVSVRLEGAAVEIDVREGSVRVAGHASTGWGDLLVANGGMLKKFVADQVITRGLSFLGLPRQVSAQAHFLLDWDDGLVCTELGVQGVSILHAAYLGPRLHVYQPKVYLGPAPASLTDTGRLGVALLAAPRADRARVDFRHCYRGDLGPRSELWSMLQEGLDAESDATP